MIKPRIGKPAALAIAGLVAAFSAVAGSATYDFNSAPPADLNFVGNAEWRDTGGKEGGYMALFDAVNSQHASVLIPDFDKGLIVAGFTFEVDLRVGMATGNGGRPADGFSISYARANDPVVADLSQEPPVDNQNNFAVAGGPENGTKTGLAISFDTWSGNTLPDGADLEGIIIRVDDKTLMINGQRGIAMPTRNGTCTDATSLQTGTWDEAANGDPSSLCWAHLKVDLAENGELTVNWKGVDIVSKLATGFAPSAGRIVFAGRTGGANENTHIDNLKIVTIPATKALYGGGSATAEGYTLFISDSGPSQVKDGTIKVQIDGADATPTSITKKDGVTTITVVTAPAVYLASGSVHACNVTFDDTQGNTGLGGTKNVTVAPYVDITPDMAVTGVSTAAANRGFLLRTWYLANPDGSAMGDLANDSARTEQELFGELGINQADQPDDFTQSIPGTSNKYAKEPDYLNHDEVPAPQGMFSENATDPQRQATEKWIPGISGAKNNMACEALFFAEFTTPGLQTFGCNSDDGFQLFVGKNPLDRFQVDGKKVGEYSGGRGTDANAPQTLFQFLIRTPGIYPMRFTWEEGGGGSNFELYQKLADGSLALVNDTTRAPSAVKAYWDGPRTARAYISKVSPGVGTFNMGFQDPVEITLTDDGTSVVDGSVKMQVNGSDVTAIVTKNGKNTSVKYAPPVTKQWVTGPNTITIKYDESGGGKRDQSFTLRVDPQMDKIPVNSFTIEAEHFDYDSGKAKISNGSGYVGDEYAGLAAVHNVDYYQDGNTPDQDGAYRAKFAEGLNPNVPMDAQTTAAPNLDVARPGFEVTTNFKIGWAGNGEWYNYTRTVPAGIYTAYSAQSIDPAADAGGTVGLVTAGAGTANQTVKQLARISGTPIGGWGNNSLLPAVDPWGGKGVFKLPGGNVTLRYTTRGGDFDYFILAPTTSPAKVVQAPDPVWTTRHDQLKWVIQNFTTSVTANSIKLAVDGADVATTATVNGDLNEVVLAGATPGVHTYTLTWNDGSSQSFSSTFNASPLPAAGAFVIEAEDFNHTGGKANPKKGTAGQDVDVMPYLGGAYQDLGATYQVDYDCNNGFDSNPYRPAAGFVAGHNVNQNENLGGRLGADRGEFSVTKNFKIGWTGGGEWLNYTRTIPAGNYNVYAALSHGDATTSATRMAAKLEKVDGDVTTTTQTATLLGTFDGPSTGGWGTNELLPMQNGGSVATVSLGGPTTLRFSPQNGDFDWFVLVPSGTAAQPKFTGIRKNADGTVTLEWTGGGTLQASPSISPATWQDVPGATSPYTFTPSAAMLFGRVRQ